ncbi:hypothetical protein OPQ81_008785 [Rhizoctonia solani]|nr:hypothetical protein OPQ81_008785 [Rhizoctonia solani]
MRAEDKPVIAVDSTSPQLNWLYALASAGSAVGGARPILPVAPWKVDRADTVALTTLNAGCSRLHSLSNRMLTIRYFSPVKPTSIELLLRNSIHNTWPSCKGMIA